MNPIELAHDLRRLFPLFSSLRDDELPELGRIVHAQRHADGFTFRMVNDPMDDLYFVIEGYVRRTFASPEGKHVTLDYLAAGEFFGAAGLVPDQMGQLSATAVEEALIYRISRSDYGAFIRERPAMLLETIRVMDGRLVKLQRRLQQLLFLDLRNRILYTLRDLATAYGEPVEAGIRLRLRLTHQDIADLIGATRETTSQIISHLRQEGKLDFDKKHPILKHQPAH